jgi:hypothetical protein
MTFFPLAPDRWVNTDAIADIEYISARSYSTGSQGAGSDDFRDPSRLEIRFRDGMTITVGAQAADAAWLAFQSAIAGTD